MSFPREAAIAVTIENVAVWLIGVHVDPPSSVRTICGYDDPLALLVQPRVSFLKATPTVISKEQNVREDARGPKSRNERTHKDTHKIQYAQVDASQKKEKMSETQRR